MSGATQAAPPRTLVLPFDFSRGALLIDADVRGRPLRMLLDTGVDPSVIDLATAEAAGVPIDRSDSGDASGVGSGAATVYAARIEALSLRGTTFPSFEAVAADMGATSAAYGGRLDAVLGYSFLSDKIVLIDYPRRSIVLLGQARDKSPFVSQRARHWSVAMATIQNFPVIPRFRIGRIVGDATFDTGSNGSIGLTPSARDDPALAGSLTATGTSVHAGARGTATERSYRIDAPVRFGPFTLPAGQAAGIYRADASDRRIANIGNGLMDALHLKVLLDYPAKRMTFFGNCPP